MNNEYKFRVLTKEDLEKGTIKNLKVRDDGGLEFFEPKKGFVRFFRIKPKREGSYTSKPLDSGIEGCRWHRIVLDADIPRNATLTVSFSSSEKEEADESWSGTIVFKNAKDALVQAPPGRYITLKIDFHRGEGEESPVLRQVKIYYPRLSYLRYLPAVYQEKSASKEFMERFLSIFESALYDSEETISRIPLYFDPKATPKHFVPWLASWLSLDLYELLGDRNREFILRAVELYKQKGTASGIARLVSFLTGKKCCVKEYMNNVFRSYGMEHDEGDEITDMRKCTKYIEDTKSYECTKFHHRTSKTVDTSKRDLLANMGKYCDEVHYVLDTSETGRYSPHVIGLFIFLLAGEKHLEEEEELHEVIDSLLPVFVRAEIITVEVPFLEEYVISRIFDEKKDVEDIIHVFLEEKIKDVRGVYKDNVNWNWLYTYKDAYNGHTNDLQSRTPHSGIGVEITL